MSLCEECRPSGICNLVANAVQAIDQGKRHERQVPNHIKRTRAAISKFGCEEGGNVEELLNQAQQAYDHSGVISNSKKSTDTQESGVQNGSSGGGLGVWNTENTGTVLWYDERGMAVTPAMQRLAAAKTVIRDNLGMPKLAAAIQTPFDKVEEYANRHPDGIIFQAAPLVFMPLSLLAHGFTRTVLGRNAGDELVGKMYHPTAGAIEDQNTDAMSQQYLTAA